MKQPNVIFDKTLQWLLSDLPYVKRFAIVTFLNYFLDVNFDCKILSILSKIISDNYYVNMALAWFFSIALIKQYNQTIKYFEQKFLPVWVHNKAIQKATESYRISNEKKSYLRSLKIKKERP